MTEAQANTLAITKKDDAGKTIFDKTHLDWQGSYVFGRMVAVGLGRAVPALAKDVRPEAAALPAEGVKAMQVMEGGPVKIVLVGDSTVNAEGGWGKGFCAIVTSNVTCVNEALNGRSSKSFLDEGAWAKSLADKGDYYLIQFGHNDQKPDAARHTDPETTFKEDLRRYVADVRAIGAVPVLVTSLSRRTYRDGKVVESLKAYAEATREVGAEEHVTVVDLNALSTKLLNGMTQVEADGFDAEAHPDAKAENAQPALDRTHLNAKGQALFGRMVADNLIRTQVELGPDIVGEPVKAAAAVVQQAAPTDGK
jgi:lysophospholipase L1-like esterase